MILQTGSREHWESEILMPQLERKLLGCANRAKLLAWFASKKGFVHLFIFRADFQNKLLTAGDGRCTDKDWRDHEHNLEARRPCLHSLLPKVEVCSRAERGELAADKGVSSLGAALHRTKLPF
jgi:hypothetical protein